MKIFRKIQKGHFHFTTKLHQLIGLYIRDVSILLILQNAQVRCSKCEFHHSFYISGQTISRLEKINNSQFMSDINSRGSKTFKVSRKKKYNSHWNFVPRKKQTREARSFFWLERERDFTTNHHDNVVTLLLNNGKIKMFKILL